MKIKVLPQELKKRCESGDAESLKESLDILIHNSLVTLAKIKDQGDFRFIQGNLSTLEEIRNLITK